MELKDLIPEYLSEDIRSSILMWEDFMNRRVAFSEFGSEIHTKKHCGRVLLFAELIADKMGLDEEMRDALAMASIFHDSRRKADGPDVGHGGRAAAYYKEFCEQGIGMLPLPFDQRTFFAMTYHDRNDDFGAEEISKFYDNEEERANALLIYDIFKDSDALDRFRLGLADGLDTNYLRTEVAREMVPFAKETVIKSMDGNTPKDIAELVRRYRLKKKNHYKVNEQSYK